MKNIYPIISIVIPAYNVENYIEDCLDPIINFTEIDFEIIVVNDGSTDNTSEKLGKYKDDRLKVINHDINKGLPAARNTGFRAASGEYILPLDSDDVPFPRSWLSLLNLIKNSPRCALVYGCLQAFQDGEVFHPNLNIRPVKPSGDVLSKIVLENGFISIGTAIINRKSVEKVGLWNESLTIGEDWEMWCRLAAEGEFIYTPILTVGYRQRKSSMTRSKVYMDFKKMSMTLDLIFENIRYNKIISAQYENLKEIAYSNFHYRYAAKSFMFGDYRNSIRHMVKSFTLHPSKILHLIKYPIRILRRLLAVDAL